MDLLPIKRAILSVTDKSGLLDFARFLNQGGVELFSTGGTRKKLTDAGLDVASVSEVTGFPEILDGRVKTLHPHIHSGILADKDNPEHLAVLAGLNLAPFDLVCVNLYNFAEAAAKNFHSVLVVPGPRHYPLVREELARARDASGNFRAPLGLRKDMAALTFADTSEYDAMIAEYLRQ